MDDKTEELLRTLRNYDSAKQAHDEEMHKCECSWDYYGHRYIANLEMAGNEFAKSLNELIDYRIDLKLNKEQ